jgi:hypothetical protein
MPGKKLILSIVAIAMLCAAAVPTSAAEATRESYVAAVEPICKANTEANEKILKGVRQKVKAGQLDVASKQVLAAARALKQTRAKLLQVPQPAADATRLAKWLGYVKTEVQLFEAVGRKLGAHETTAAQKLVVRLYSNARQANNQVLDFEFRYCKFQPSKFI